MSTLRAAVFHSEKLARTGFDQHNALSSAGGEAEAAGREVDVQCVGAENVEERGGPESEHAEGGSFAAEQFQQGFGGVHRVDAR